MRFLHVAQWRVALAYAAPVVIAATAVSLYLADVGVKPVLVVFSILALLVAAVSIAGVYSLWRRTVLSVRSVTESARQLAEGNLDHRVDAPVSDETKTLADAFNKMASSLRDIVRDLSGERNKLSAVLDTMADGVLVIGPNRRVELVNLAAQDLLDIKAPQALGGHFMDIVRDHDLQQLASSCREAGQRQLGEVELLHRRRFVSAIATPLSEADSSGVLLTLHDLTRIRQVETTRKEFVSNVSHELRSPLASIKAMVETVEDRGLEDSRMAADFLLRIHKDLDRMSSIVDDLLDLARLETGQVALRLEPLDARALIDEVMAEYKAQASEKGIGLVVNIPEGLPQVLAEEQKLRQVLVNLLENALKFTNKGEVAVSGAVQDGFVSLEVADTGPGIPPEHRPHIFERFYKVDRSRRDGGSGLGLAIVKHIIQAHGGEAKVVSQEGVGSTFVITIPRIDNRFPS